MANMAFILKSPRLVLILMFCSSVHVIPLKMEHAMFNNVTVIFLLVLPVLLIMFQCFSVNVCCLLCYFRDVSRENKSN